MQIPTQYNQLMPYLVLTGSAHFKQFMQTVFDAKEQLMVIADDGSIMHGEIKIGNAVIMFGEASKQFPVMSAGMFIYVESADTTYKKALDAGAITVPGQEPSDKDYGRSCGVTDPFGNIWWITSVIK